RALYASYGLTAGAADAALKQTRGRAATLDARARGSLPNEESDRAARYASAPRPLRLVKGFRKSSLGTV
ncbi:MAG TPA: hypothetical protein VK422_10235, partial [Pyrinomonadaceae bacterium]|nr:hypothetical protein [Pyrinomonadaceae bacterium]